MVYSSNKSLTLEQMTVNAQYILDFLLHKGWTKNAVCGMLGNMQAESSINPGRWQMGYSVWNMDAGFGLVQWTPASKYFDWARGYYGCTNQQAITMDKELSRILWEVQNNKQWISSLDTQGRTFSQFTQSTDTPYDLAMAFIKAYERPKNPNQPYRGERAEYWYSTLTGGGIPSPPPPPTEDNAPDNAYPSNNYNSRRTIIHLMLCDSLNGWKW